MKYKTSTKRIKGDKTVHSNPMPNVLSIEAIYNHSPLCNILTLTLLFLNK